MRAWLSGPRLPIALLIIITISRAHQYFGFLAKVRPALLLFAWAALALMFGRNEKTSGNLKEQPARAILWLGFAAVLSAPLGISFGHSATILMNSYWKVIATAIMVVLAIRNEDDLWLMIWSYVIAVGILAWMTITVFKTETSGFGRLVDGFTYDANDIGLVCITGLPLCLIVLRTSGRMGKLAALLVIALACIGIARSGSRGAFVGVITVGVALLVISRQVSAAKRIGIAVVGAAALAIAAPAGYMKQMSTILNPTDDYNWQSRTGRKEIALRGFGYLKRNPITGIGIANFPMAEGTLSDAAVAFEAGEGAGVKWSAAHNSYLESTVEMGLVGGGLFIFLVWCGIRSGVDMRRASVGRSAPGIRGDFMRSVSDYLPIAFIGFAVPAFFLSFAYMDPVYVMAAFAAAAIAIARRYGKGVPAQAVPRGVRAMSRRLPAR